MNEIGGIPLLPHEAIEIVVEGATTDPQLNHPEGICIASDGYVWCGGERGEIYRIDPHNRTFEQVSSTNGFALGMNFDDNGFLYICDSKHKAVYRYEPATGSMLRFSDGSADEKMRIPNYPVYDRKRGVLYVSDSYDFGGPGPGIWRIDIRSGTTELWCRHSFSFANGMALSADQNTLYIAESRGGPSVYRIPIMKNGEAGEAETLATIPGVILDGLALAENGRLYITCYEPSRIYRLDTTEPSAPLELLVEDRTAHELCHPTNCALSGDSLYISNLGRWHISKVSLKSVGI